jgi:glutamate N-acetyltransferase/amino-acid N-acetyltransferase
VQTPQGFRYSACYAGIRKVENPDLALIVSKLPATAAGMFTTNLVQAAPLRLCREHLAASHGVAHAILVNAGNANCATRTGDRVARSTSAATARALRVPAMHVLPASTGVIGVEMDGRKVLAALPQLVAGLDESRFLDAADAILTTDTVRKVAFAEAGGIRIAGMTKGAGMIQPNMATTLAFVLTDALVEPAALRRHLGVAIERSFHRVSVDGDTSTNDTALLLANGAAGRKPGPGFAAALNEVFESLARQIANDGEGAEHLIEIEVSGASSHGAAAKIARAIANSPLVKTAIAGADANWGRILAAAGYSGAAFDPATAEVWLQGVRVCRNGLAAPFDEEAMQAKLRRREVAIRLVIGGGGRGAARFWTCDFTENYIRINASYRT